MILKCTAQKNRNNRRKTRNITDVERLYDYRNMVTEACEDEVFYLKMDFKKNEPVVSNKKLPDWVRVDRTTDERYKR